MTLLAGSNWNWFWWIIGAGFLLAAVVTWIALFRAPMGEERDEGFCRRKEEAGPAPESPTDKTGEER